MKKITLLTLILFSSVLSFSQETSIINIGAGYPFFFHSNFDENSGGTHSITFNRFHVFIEIPQLIEFRNNSNFSFTPGAGYFLFNEEESGGGLGGGSSASNQYKAISLYAKLNYSITNNSEKPFRWYAGIFSGFYVYSKTTGNFSWWASQQGGTRSGEYEIDQSGKPFFNIFYNGVYAGFKTITGKNAWVQPAFELSFLPGFANITDKYLGENDSAPAKSMVMLSVILGLGTKKATRING